MGLALFDERVTDETKAGMVANFSRQPNLMLNRRLDKKTFSLSTPPEQYVTSGTTKFFDLLCLKGQEKASTFLSLPPSFLNDDLKPTKAALQTVV